MTIRGEHTMQSSACLRPAIAFLVALLGACSSTSVEEVWHDPDRAAAPIGKTLVIAVAPQRDVAIALENEWVGELQHRGIDARALNAMLSGERQPDKQRVVGVVKADGFDTVLVSRVVEKKTVEQNVSVSGAPVHGTPGYYGTWYDFYGTSRTSASNASYTVEREVAVVETNLYEAAGEKLFWSARSDTFVEGSAAELIRGFVEVTTKEMARSNLL